MHARRRARGTGSLRAWGFPAAVLAFFGGLLLSHSSGTIHPGPLERRATHVKPAPATAGSEKPRPFFEGCMIGEDGTRSGRCLYGDKHGRRTLILFGDSHALQHFPALQAVARHNGWKLVVLTKGDCTPGRAPILDLKSGEGEYSQCDAWRSNMIRRIEGTGGRAVVAIGGYTTYTAYGPGGKELHGRANAAALEAGYVSTLRRLKRAGLAAVVIRDVPEAPTGIASCVAAHMSDLRACAFREHRGWGRSFDMRAAKRVGGTGAIDVVPAICPHRLCRAVIHDVLVYRDDEHLTAAFSRTVGGLFEPALKRAMR